MYKAILKAYKKFVKDIKISEGKSLEEISVYETALGCKFPDELTAFYQETNGDGCFICSLDELKWINLRMREVVETVFVKEKLLIVGTSFSKYFYCYRIDTETGKCQNGLYRYNRENEAVYFFAHTLDELIERHYSNKE